MQRKKRTRIEYREQGMGKLTCTPLIDYYYGHEYNYTYDCTHRYWLKSSVSLVTIMGLTWIIGETNREFVM